MISNLFFYLKMIKMAKNRKKQKSKEQRRAEDKARFKTGKMK